MPCISRWAPIELGERHRADVAAFGNGIGTDEELIGFAVNHPVCGCAADRFLVDGLAEVA